LVVESDNLTSVWTSTSPGNIFPAVNFTNGTGTFINSFVPDARRAVITSATTFNLIGDQRAMYAVVW
jgi:hypothetical protein